VWDVWFDGQIGCSKIEHLSNIDEKHLPNIDEKHLSNIDEKHLSNIDEIEG
jgi:hypothetical protein